MTGNAGEWCLMESDPGVFTELIKGFGCRGAQVEEIWSLEPENFEKLKPVHGLIFLFKWQPGEEPAGSVVQDSRLDTIFFAKQVINNACATQAIVSVLLNCTHQDVHLGETLSEFKEFSQSFDAAMKGLALSNSDVIRQVHNSFARQQMFEFDAKTSAKEEDAFHFVSYVPVNGRLYELDGLREGPIDLGACNQDDWISAVRPVIEKRIQNWLPALCVSSLCAVTRAGCEGAAARAPDLRAELACCRLAGPPAPSSRPLLQQSRGKSFRGCELELRGVVGAGGPFQAEGGSPAAEGRGPGSRERNVLPERGWGHRSQRLSHLVGCPEVTCRRRSGLAENAPERLRD
ncbi:PREDICTED: ubiquitin carboxyl-terminal hydrolase isozyme L5 [Propithecus coquereli]|uniref:ubiquitin carboxyl-terminal hydrolase isozyme L5 n=1 Tax=Propithecus coquereli TaxID=379532 RepID=UPI00063F12FB|nr:PREDICTED: ubiquitin carboxyl-terminal hydrolase isozyme L5 [Propithecus coquereli]